MVKRARYTPTVPKPMLFRTNELKYVDVALDSAVNNAGVILLINGMARGADVSERIGRQVIIKSIQVYLTGLATTTTGIDQTHRYMLVYDKQTNGAFPVGADILNAISPWAMKNLNNRSRFIILWDKRISVSNDVPANQAGGNVRLADMDYYRRHSLRVTFNDSNLGTVADINTGAIYFVCMGSVAAGATAGSCIGYSRIRFVDA